MVVLAAQNAPIQFNVPDPSGAAWALFAIVVALLVAFLIAFAISLHGSKPEQRPAIIETRTPWVRAVGDAVRPFRRRETPPPSPRPPTAVPPPPPAPVSPATAELPEPRRHDPAESDHGRR